MAKRLAPSWQASWQESGQRMKMDSFRERCRAYRGFECFAHRVRAEWSSVHVKHLFTLARDASPALTPECPRSLCRMVDRRPLLLSDHAMGEIPSASLSERFRQWVASRSGDGRGVRTMLFHQLCHASHAGLKTIRRDLIGHPQHEPRP